MKLVKRKKEEYRENVCETCEFAKPCMDGWLSLDGTGIRFIYCSVKNSVPGFVTYCNSYLPKITMNKSAIRLWKKRVETELYDLGIKDIIRNGRF